MKTKIWVICIMSLMLTGCHHIVVRHKRVVKPRGPLFVEQQVLAPELVEPINSKPFDGYLHSLLCN